MSNVYVVIEESGEYSDHELNIIDVYAKKSTAQRVVSRLAKEDERRCEAGKVLGMGHYHQEHSYHWEEFELSHRQPVLTTYYRKSTVIYPSSERPVHATTLTRWGHEPDPAGEWYHIAPKSPEWAREYEFYAPEEGRSIMACGTDSAVVDFDFDRLCQRAREELGKANA